MINCAYFFGLTKNGFVKEIKMDHNEHSEDSLPKIGELFSGRYTDEEPVIFIGLCYALQNYSDDRVFIDKNNEIKVIDTQKVKEKLSKCFQSLINQLTVMPSNFAKDYSYVSKNEHRNIMKDNTSYNIETIKSIEDVYKIQASPVDKIDTVTIKKEMCSITTLSAMLGLSEPQDEVLLSRFNRLAIGTIATGMSYGNVFNVDDVIESAMAVSYSNDGENNFSIEYSDVMSSYRRMISAKEEITSTLSHKKTMRF